MAKRIDTDNMDVGQPQSLRMPEEGDAVIIPEHGYEAVEPTTAVGAMDQAAHLAFNEELVTIYIHPGDKFAVNPVPLAVNGRNVAVPRGTKCTVKRKYVGVLARSKHVSTGQEEIIVNGVQGFRYPQHTSPAFPFRVVEDANPIGEQWLNGILQEPA